MTSVVTSVTPDRNTGGGCAEAESRAPAASTAATRSEAFRGNWNNMFRSIARVRTLLARRDRRHYNRGKKGLRRPGRPRA